MLIKLLGLTLILTVGSVSAYGAVRYEKRRLSVLDGWLDLIRYIRSQIDCYLKPIDEILREGDRKLLGACLAPHPTDDLSQILRHSSVYLDGESCRLAEGFVRELGGSYREDQLRRCDYYLEGLRARRERIATELPARIRLSAGLCLCISLGTVILIW